MSYIKNYASDIFSLSKDHKNLFFRKDLVEALKEVKKDWKDWNRNCGLLCDKLINDDLNHKLRISDCGTLVVYNKDKKEIQLKFYKYIAKFYPDIYFTDMASFVEEVIGLAGGYRFIENNIVYYKGDDIIEQYKNEGNRFNSCMGGRNSFYVKIYALNPKKVSLIVLGNHLARALLWTDDNGNKILDRVYPSGSKYGSMFKNWAQKNNILYRKVIDDLCEGSADISDGRSHKVTLKYPRKKFFPYMDTFKYGKALANGTEIIVKNIRTDKYKLSLTSTEGHYYGYSDKLKTECYECCSRSYLIFDIKRKKYICDDCLY